MHSSDQQSSSFDSDSESVNIKASIIKIVIIHMKKLLDSDWVRAVQFKCNTSAKSVTPVQITHRNSG